jgi:pyruvate formate lyase activating enzyme
VWLELTTLLIPGLNDSEREIEEMTQWVVENLGPDVPWHFTAFHPEWKMRDIPATPRSTLVRAHAIARRNGVRYAYTGNVHDEAHGATYCHGCDTRLIGRDWYRITDWNLGPGGTCRTCGTACAGLFDADPGTWGAKRQPVRLLDYHV